MTTRVLVIDDRIPDPTLGSGYGRMLDTIRSLEATGSFEISLYPTLGAEKSGSSRLFKVVTEPLAKHLAAESHAGHGYHAVIISRPHNYEYAINVLRAQIPHAAVIYDVESLYFRRLERQAELASGQTKKDLLAEAAVMRGLEQRIAAEVDALVCIATDEADLLASHARYPITVNSPLLTDAVWTSGGFGERRGVGFVAGWVAGSASPNVDGLRWFARHVWPRVLARVPDAELLVTGADPPPEVRRFERESVRFAGSIPDLHEFYAGVRLVVVPIRYGSGVKLKAIEALQSGVPVVATSVGAEGIPLAHAAVLEVTNDARQFSELVARLLQDEAAWEAHRQAIARQHLAWQGERHANAWPDVLARLVAENGERRTGHD
jgi:O-antigen biosynthesis protein